MCPACISTMAWVVAGATSAAGGITAILVKNLKRRKQNKYLEGEFILSNNIQNPTVVSRDEWIDERKQFLTKE